MDLASLREKRSRGFTPGPALLLVIRREVRVNLRGPVHEVTATYFNVTVETQLHHSRAEAGFRWKRGR